MTNARRNSTRDIDFGFGIYDSELQDKYRFRTRVQVLNPKPPKPEDQRVFCANCKSRMEWIGELMNIHFCRECGQYVDYKLQDAHITNMDGDKFGPYSEVKDNEPFLKNVKLNSKVPDYSQTSYGKQRVKSLKVKGSAVEAFHHNDDE